MGREGEWGKNAKGLRYDCGGEYDHAGVESCERAR